MGKHQHTVRIKIIAETDIQNDYAIQPLLEPTAYWEIELLTIMLYNLKQRGDHIQRNANNDANANVSFGSRRSRVCHFLFQ